MSETPVIYIAGPFRGPTSWAIEGNIRRVESVGLDVHRAGGIALIPHTMYRYFQGEASDRTWLDATLELLRRSDAILLCGPWTASAGSCGELAEAQARGLAAYEVTESRPAYTMFPTLWVQRLESGAGSLTRGDAIPLRDMIQIERVALMARRAGGGS